MDTTNTRKLYDLVINSLIFSRLYYNTQGYGNLIYYSPACHIRKRYLNDEILVQFITREWTIHKYETS